MRPDERPAVRLALVDGARDGARLTAFLAGSGWPFHRDRELTEHAARELVASRGITGAGTRAHWVLAGSAVVGLVVLHGFDEDSGRPGAARSTPSAAPCCAPIARPDV